MTPLATDDRARATSRRRAAVAGVLGVGAAVGVSELAAAVLTAAPSLVVAVGDAVIDAVPGWLERAAIAALGSNDKPVLLAGILVVAALLGAALGALAQRSRWWAVAGFPAFAALGVAAGTADDRNALLSTVLVGVLGAGAGIAGLLWLLRTTTVRAAPDAGRRAFLLAAGSVAALAVVSGLTGLVLSARDRLDEIRAAIRLPVPARRAGPVPPGADLDVEGLTPLFVPNRDFYRIDTALRVPVVEPDGWRLQVRGMVDRPFSLTYEELLTMPQIEADVTLVCVSNEVGGGLAGNARWQGVPLVDLLERAGPHDGATQLIGRSVDGFTAGFPTRTALDVEDAMVAVAMNGEPLPVQHGFPARLVVPGLYGYVSATKWLSAIELTDWDVDGYWVPRGWAKEGPIKTQSRIDVPRPGSDVPAGRRVIAGVAWAPTRGIEAVEVRIDDGPWQPARLAASVGVDAWRQWVLPWDATPGEHVVSVRATDGTGEVQTDERTPVAPDGAAGRHTVVVRVR